MKLASGFDLKTEPSDLSLDQYGNVRCGYDGFVAYEEHHGDMKLSQNDKFEIALLVCHAWCAWALKGSK